MRVYARPFDRQDTRPRVALILGGVGLRASLSEEAIRTLPRNIALAFTPYAPNPAPLIEAARDRDFETLLALPMEPTGFPMNDPGHRALLTTLSAGENAQRLDWLLARFPGHVGAVGAIASMRGERFAAMAEPFAQMQLALNARGLLYFDVRPGAPHPERVWGFTVDVVVDEPHTRGEIEQRLAQLERLARERGSALGYLGEVTPVALERLIAWTGGLDARGVALAPVTALVRRPEIATR
nr:divergent polysaccharide deacetylase family protein [Roseococcus sp. SDR]